MQSDGAQLEMRGKMVPVGDRVMQRELTYTRASGDGKPGLEIRIEVVDGAPVVKSVKFSAVPGGNGVRVTDLKNLVAQLEDLTEWMCATAAWVRNPSGAHRDFPVLAEARQAAMPSIRRARKPTRRKLTKEFLTRVADTYRDAERAPTEAVKAAFGVEHRTAGRYVAAARKAGLLPQTTRGKGSAGGEAS